MTRRGRSGRFDEERALDALGNTPKRQPGGVAASIPLTCTPQCLGATINSATRYRSASVTGLAPSPRCPWGCEKPCDAMRNMRDAGCGALAPSRNAGKRMSTKKLEKSKMTAICLTVPAQDVNAATTQGASDGSAATVQSGHKDTVECDCNRFPVQNSFGEMSVRSCHISRT